jgi:hypothetical protein
MRIAMFLIVLCLAGCASTTVSVTGSYSSGPGTVTISVWR